MARYYNTFVTPKTPEQIGQIINMSLTSAGFQYTTIKGEQIWKKGHGVLTAPQCIKVEIAPGNSVIIQAWLKIPLLPGVYIGEQNLDGFYGIVIKNALRQTVMSLEMMLR
jgi:hypothetical protein